MAIEKKMTQLTQSGRIDHRTTFWLMTGKTAPKTDYNPTQAIPTGFYLAPSRRHVFAIAIVHEGFYGEYALFVESDTKPAY